MSDPKPVLREDTIYADHDRFVCGTIRCAGATAIYTGRTIAGRRVTKVTAADVIEWATYDLGPLACECGRLVALVTAGRVRFESSGK